MAITDILHDGAKYSFFRKNEIKLTSLEDTNKKELVIPSEIDGLKVTLIDQGAFQQSGLEKVTLPEGLLILEKSSFNQCNRLETIEIPETVVEIKTFCFSDCASLKQVIIKSKTISIVPDSCFLGCQSLVDIQLPDQIRYLGTSAFSYCTSLETIVLPKELLDVGVNAFHSCEKLSNVIFKNLNEPLKGKGSIRISRGAFSDCLSLSNINLPTIIYSLGKYAFSRAPLKEIILDKIGSLEAGCFLGLHHLERLTIKNNSKMFSFGKYYEIQNGILYEIHKYCKYLHTVFPFFKESTLKIEDVSTIFPYAFTLPTSLKKVYVNSPNIKLRDYSFRESSFVEIEINSTIQGVPSFCFNDCKLLEKIIFNKNTNKNTIEKIGRGAFLGCSRLTSIQLPEGVTSLQENCFALTALTELNIPKSVQKIGAHIVPQTVKELVVSSPFIEFESFPFYTEGPSPVTTIVIKQGSRKDLLSFKNNTQTLLGADIVSLSKDNYRYKSVSTSELNFL